MSLQKRNFLLLSKSESSSVARKILKSPLGLAEELTILLHEDGYEDIRQNLDIIKQFVAGINRADSLSGEYCLAAYYPKMFAFHQFFNSSSRARQGKVLESMIQEIIKRYTDCSIVPEKVAEMQEVIKESFGLASKSKLDIDALGVDEKNKKMLVVQIRSRDDTGGTTAKGSLVDFLLFLLRSRKKPKHKITYLIAVWDERNSQQKNSTVSKMFSSVSDNIQITEEKFRKNISKGVGLVKNIELKLAYGVDEIVKSIYDWNHTKSRKLLSSIEQLTNTLESWDDLWVSYAICSLELDLKEIRGVSNVKILDRYLEKLSVDFGKVEKASQIDSLAVEIAKKWKEDTIPLPGVSDRILYIRDLIYLRKIYHNLK